MKSVFVFCFWGGGILFVLGTHFEQEVQIVDIYKNIYIYIYIYICLMNLKHVFYLFSEACVFACVFSSIPLGCCDFTTAFLGWFLDIFSENICLTTLKHRFYHGKTMIIGKSNNFLTKTTFEEKRCFFRPPPRAPAIYMWRKSVKKNKKM